MYFFLKIEFLIGINIVNKWEKCIYFFVFFIDVINIVWNKVKKILNDYFIIFYRISIMLVNYIINFFFMDFLLNSCVVV